jgi:hypothetical protein
MNLRAMESNKEITEENSDNYDNEPTIVGYVHTINKKIGVFCPETEQICYVGNSNEIIIVDTLEDIRKEQEYTRESNERHIPRSENYNMDAYGYVRILHRK